MWTEGRIMVEWYVVLAFVLGVPLLAVPVGYIWYLNGAGFYRAFRPAEVAEKGPAAEEAGIRVLVVDDHAMVREGLRALLRPQKDIRIVGEAVNGQEAVEMVSQLSPDVVLMDIRMPVMNGVEAAKRITEGGQTRVLMLTQYDEDDNVFASRAVGALGFVPKRSAGPELLQGIRAVHQGKRYMPCIASYAA